MILTYNQIIKVLSDFADSHFQINSFGNGDLWESIQHNQLKDFKYPLMWAEDMPSSASPGVLELNFRMYFMSLVNKDESNENEVKSDQLQILLDLFSFWDRQEPNRQITIDRNISVDSFTERTQDELTGWTFDLRIEMPFRYNACAIPKDGQTPTPTFCAAASVANSDSSFTATIASGGSLVLDDNTYEIFVNGVSESITVGPSVVDQVLNISIT